MTAAVVHCRIHSLLVSRLSSCTGAEASVHLDPIISSVQLIAGGMLLYLAAITIIGEDARNTVLLSPLCPSHVDLFFSLSFQCYCEFIQVILLTVDNLLIANIYNI